MPKKLNLYRILIYVLVFFSGFASLATEIIGPRLVASLFGSTTIIWAIIISVTLVGISVGYFIGGRIPKLRVKNFLPGILLLNAAWLVAVSWLVWKIPASVAGVGYFSIGLTLLIAFFPPAVLFSMVSPLAISLVSGDCPPESISKVVGNIYSLGTLGSVIGALSAAFLMIPWIGLSFSLRLFAALAVFFAILFLPSRLKVAGLLAFLAVVLIPQPIYPGLMDYGAVLLAQIEGYYQTIRVYSDNATYVRMDLGPGFNSKMSLIDYEPMLGYAVEMVKQAGDVNGKQVLIIGGAGHTQARALEKRGALVTEVEIDPFVVEASDRYFGKVQAQLVLADGRPYLDQLRGEKFDLILMDAFNGLASVPLQLTTREFFETADRSLAPGGRLLYNLVGVPQGPKSNSFRALAATMEQVFADTRASQLEGDQLTNLILIASNSPLDDTGYPRAPTGGVVLTDDLNPAEIFFEQAIAGYYSN